LLDTKHPGALGRPFSECCKEIWHIVKPLIETRYSGGQATQDDDILPGINRYGFVEETQSSFVYNPVPDETVPGGIGGVLATIREITGRGTGDRHLQVLRDLNARSAEGETATEACSIAAEILAAHAIDIPFVLLYLIDPDRRTARLAGSAGVVAGGRTAPTTVSLETTGTGAKDSPWPLAKAMHSGRIEMVTDLAGCLGSGVPPGPWTDPPHTAVIAPILSHKLHNQAGFLVAGISSRLRPDDAYRDFVTLVASQIATSIANARESEEEKKRAGALTGIDRAKTLFSSHLSDEFGMPMTLMPGDLENLLSQNDTCKDMAQVLKLAEKAIRESEERFRTFVTASSEVVYRMSPDWTEMRHLEGKMFIPDTHSPSTSWTDTYINPDDLPYVQEVINEAIRNRSIFDLEHRVLRVDGTLGWTHSRAIPIFDRDGTIIEWFGTACDITERKEVEIALIESENRFYELVNSIDEFFLAFDKHWTITYTNEYTTSEFGLAQEDIIGKNVWELFPDARDTIFWDNYHHAMNRRESISFEVFGPYKKYWLEMRAFPSRDGIVVLGKDITKRRQIEQDLKENEAILRSFFDASGIMRGIVEVIADDEVRHIDDNSVTCSFIGLTPENMRNKTSSELGEPREITRLWVSRYRESQRTGKPVTFRYHDKRETKEAWLEATVTYLGTGRNGLSRFAYVISDVTESEQAGAALRQKQAEIQALFSNIPVGLVLFDAKPPYTVVVHNRFYQELFAEPFYSKGMTGLNIYDYAPEVDASGVTAVLDKAVETRMSQHVLDFPYKSNPPEERWFNWYLAPIVIDDRVISLVSMSLDVTATHQAEQIQKNQMDKLDILADAARILLSVESPENIIQQICQRVMTFLDCQFFFNYFVDDIPGSMHLNAYAGIPENEAEKIADLDFGVAVCGCVGRDGIPIIIENVQNAQDNRTALIQSFGVTAYACHPLVYQGRILGTLSFGTRTRAAFTSEEINLMKAVTDLVATAMTRRRAENSLRESEERYRIISDYSSDWIFWIDPNENFLYISPAADWITGRQARTHTAIRSFLHDIIHPDDLEMRLAHLDSVMKERNSGNLKFRIVRPDGEVRWIHHICNPVYDETGQFLGIRGSNRDITDAYLAEKALIQSEEKFRVLALNTPDTMTVQNSRLLYTTVINPFLGRNEQEMLGRTDIELFSGEDSASLTSIKQDVLITGRSLTRNLTLHNKNGRQEYFIGSFIPGRDGKGTINAIIGYLRNVTENVQTQERMSTAIKEKEMLIREVHHRVKNNLQIISGLLDMTRMRAGDTTTMEILTDMMMKVQTMAQIHTDLYESRQFDRIDMEKQVRAQTMAISSVYANEGKHITWKITSGEIVLPVNKAIPCMLVINEILSNAFKHAFRGRKTGKISITLGQEDGMIRVSVRDNGVGMPTGIDIEQSTSLGMKLIRTLVNHQLNGTYRIRNIHGTEIVIEFPRYKEGLERCQES
jgi:PAS domain S-box-containing protein